MGYWRAQSSDAIEVTLAHPFGIAEIEIGAVTGHRVELMTHSIEGSPTAKDVSRVERSFHVVQDAMTYDLRMAAVGHPITHHLHADLRMVDE
jgi:THAP4-like, heme-binding beta-barrel domain